MLGTSSRPSRSLHETCGSEMINTRSTGSVRRRSRDRRGGQTEQRAAHQRSCDCDAHALHLPVREESTERPTARGGGHTATDARGRAPPPGKMGAVNFVGHIATGLRIGDDPVDPRIPRRHRVARLRGDGPHPPRGRRTVGSATASPSTTPPTRRSTPRRGSSTSSASCAGSSAKTACPTAPHAPAPTWARSCCSTARCSTTPPIASGVRTVYARDRRARRRHRRPRARRPARSVARASRRCGRRASIPFTYGDAAIVAQRLHTITSRRPRLAFDDDLVGAVRARMVSVQPRIMSSATDVLDRVVGAVSGTRPRRRFTLRK